MPEGPEVRRYADMLGRVLTHQPIVSLSARTKAAKAWLAAHPNILVGRQVERVRAHGKNLIGDIAGGYYFYSHLMMWGRWQVVEGSPPDAMDRRERARIVAPEGAAILLSAPIFEVGEGDAEACEPTLRALGPDVLPYDGPGAFDSAGVLHRLLAPAHLTRSIGAALLDQTILAGIGNYLRAEILFVCRLDPWKLVGDLTADELALLMRVIPEMAAYAYATGGASAPEALRERMRTDTSLVYAPGREFGARHYVFRRTNLPCLVCGAPIRQKRQITRQDEEDERERIIYFCPSCQNTTIELPAVKKKPSPPAPLRGEPASQGERGGANWKRRAPQPIDN